MRERVVLDILHVLFLFTKIAPKIGNDQLPQVTHIVLGKASKQQVHKRGLS